MSEEQVPEECIAYIGEYHPAHVGSWVSTLDGTLYRVCAEPIKISRDACVYDVPVDIRTACTAEEWKQKRW